MTSWRDFDVPDEPMIALRDEISPMREQVPVGRLGVPYNRDVERVFVKKVTRGNPPEDATHYYNKFEGYAISKDILDQLELHDVGLVFTYEEDTDLVLEHTLQAYLDGPQVDNGVYGNDEQYAASEWDAEYRWDDLGVDLFTNESFWSQT